VKTWIVPIALLSLTGLVRADELDDGFAALKEAVTAKKDAETIKKLAVSTSALARKAATATKPADVEADSWKQRLGFAKDVDTYSEYALAFAAIQPATDAAKVVDLVDTLIAQNSKSKYMELVPNAYLSALGKEGGGQKLLDGAAKVNAFSPENEDALLILADGNLQRSPDRALTYANKLATVMRTKAKPEGVAEAAWEARKGTMLGHAYYDAGIVAGQKQIWVDCDRDFKAALPFIGKEPSMAGVAYFYLGLCNYQYGRLTQDRTRIQAGQKYSEQSAAIPGPMQAQANQNAVAMKRELGAPVVQQKK
jgi:hypothetical protein